MTRLREYVQDRLAGDDRKTRRRAGAGSRCAWVGRRHGPPSDRRWAKSWSPEQISNRLRVDFPDDESMRISHEAIYQALYIQGRGALRRELVACLRTGRALRVPRARTRGRGKKFVTPEIMISERPAEADDRAVPGHWEGDLIIGLEQLRDRHPRRTHHAVHDAAAPAPHGQATARPTVKNGPALAGHGAEAVRDAIAASITTLPEQLRRSLTWDQGAEMAQHAQLRDRHRPRTSTSATRTAPGSGAPTRTPTDCYASTSPRAPTSPDTPETTSTPSPRPQQPTPQDPRMEDTRRSPRRASTLAHKAVLRRLLEPKQYLAIRYTERLEDAGAALGGIEGDSYDNALAETVNGLYKAELISRRGPWRSVEQVEVETAAWVHWWNAQRLHGACGDIPPAEYEAAYWTDQQEATLAA